MRLRGLRLAISTPNGPFGTTLSFSDGLVVLRAENSSGKSTCIQAVIYSLGLEGMLSASHAVPLAHAMTDEIFDPRNGQIVPVTESYVQLEVENDRHEVMTVLRYSKHPTIATQLVRVWEEAALSSTAQRESVDYFVRRSGAAQREAGFHHRLADFIGWDLPMVPSFDQSPKPLYLETLFPLFVVEQKRGWSAIQAQVPTQFRIRDVRRRALEFVLELASGEASARLESLQSEAAAISQEWRDRGSQIYAEVRSNGGVIQNLPTQPVPSWPPVPVPRVIVPSHLEGDEAWVGLMDAVAQARAALAELEAKDVPTSGRDRGEAGVELGRTEHRLSRLVALAAREAEELETERHQLEAASIRVDDLLADLRRHQDLNVLQRLGGDGHSGRLVPHDCPTCHQTLPPTLLEEATAPRVMTLDESIRHIEQERQLFQDIEADSRRIVAAKQARLDGLREAIAEARSRIVAFRNTLTSPDDVPSEAAVEQRVSLRSKIRRLTSLESMVDSRLSGFAELASAWSDTQSEIARLRQLDLSAIDEPKRIELERSLREQLVEYGFDSVPPNSISVSEDTWLPSHEGFDLGFDLSASDSIRLIWAYLLALLELDRFYDMNHARLLIFDEPRQQMAHPDSFAAFIRRASKCKAFGQQMVVATSETRGQLDGMLAGAEAQVIDFEHRKILVPEEAP